MKSPRITVLIGFAWVVMVIAFQGWKGARITPQWPDRSLSWMANFTDPSYQQGQKYLVEPFLNNQVAWNSTIWMRALAGPLCT